MLQLCVCQELTRCIGCRKARELDLKFKQGILHFCGLLVLLNDLGDVRGGETGVLEDFRVHAAVAKGVDGEDFPFAPTYSRHLRADWASTLMRFST